MAKTVVLGASGYLGGRLIHSLCEETNVDDVLAIGGSTRYMPDLGVSYVTSEDGPRLLRALRGEFVTVINCANHYRSENPNSFSQLKANYLWPLRILDALPKSCSIHWVEVSSRWALTRSMIENFTLYGFSKVAAISTLRSHCGSRGGDFSYVIVGDVFGQRDPRRKLPSTVVNLLGTKQTVQVTGGQQVLTPMFVDDVSKAICGLLMRRQPVRVMLRADDFTLSHFVRTVNKLLKRKALVLHEGPVLPSAFGVAEPQLDLESVWLPSFERTLKDHFLAKGRKA